MFAAMIISLPSLFPKLPKKFGVRARRPQMGGGAPYPYNLITVEPTYTINNPEAVQSIMLKYVARSKSEAGLCYCGFSTTRSAWDETVPGWPYSATSGDTLFVREAFPDAEATLFHLSAVAQPGEKWWPLRLLMNYRVCGDGSPRPSRRLCRVATRRPVATPRSPLSGSSSSTARPR